MRTFFDRSESRHSLDERFGLCKSSHFDFKRARSEVTLAEALSCIRPILYRPFDRRYVVYHPLILGEPRLEVMRHLLAGSVALLSTRRVTGRPYDNVFVCRGLVEYKAATHDRNTQVFPLYVAVGGEDDRATLFAKGDADGRYPNLAPRILEEVSDGFGVRSPDEVFSAVYASLFSAEYRCRFREQLQQDYARVPLPASPPLSRALAKCGGELVALHLLESPKLDDFITTYTGPKNPEVGRVVWSDNAVWLDALATRIGERAKPGSIGFLGVPEAVWIFHIGGYQVCEKWLKDRKGRRLSRDDIAHYQKIVVALSETIRIMKEIDEVIERHGGWPGAFKGSTGQISSVTEAMPLAADPMGAYRGASEEE